MTSYYSKLWNTEFHEGDEIEFMWGSDIRTIYQATINKIQKSKFFSHKDEITIFLTFTKGYLGSAYYGNGLFESKSIIPTILNRKHNEIIEIEDEEYNELFI